MPNSNTRYILDVYLTLRFTFRSLLKKKLRYIIYKIPPDVLDSIFDIVNKCAKLSDRNAKLSGRNEPLTGKVLNLPIFYLLYTDKLKP